MRVKVFDFTTSEFRMEDRTVKTLDGVEITCGLRVWDYDLQRGVIAYDDDLSVPDVDNSGQVWFYVDRDGPDMWGAKLMSDTRVWVRHPTTGEKA
jgi:hypothetical protein